MVVFLIPIIAAICIAFILYTYLKGRHTERMSIIDKGMDATQINFGGPTKWAVLRVGMLMIGLGMGLYIGTQLTMDMFERGVSIPASTIVCGGIMLVLNFVVEQKWRKE